jgi:hypothetical protein
VLRASELNYMLRGERRRIKVEMDKKCSRVEEFLKRVEPCGGDGSKRLVFIRAKHLLHTARYTGIMEARTRMTHIISSCWVLPYEVHVLAAVGSCQGSVPH